MFIVIIYQDSYIMVYITSFNEAEDICIKCDKY